MTTPNEPGQPGQPGENKPFEPLPSAPALNEAETAGFAPTSRPKSVDNAWMLWMIGAGLSLLSLIVSLTIGSDDIRKAAEDSLKSQNRTYTQSDIDSLVSISIAVVIVIGIILIGLFVLFAYKMRAGRNWARITLTALGGLSILFTLIGVGNSGVASLIVGLVQAVLIVGAVYFMFRPESSNYFATGRRRR